MPRSLKSVVAGAALVVAAVALVNAPFLLELWRVIRLDDVYYSADSSTHFVRMMHTRNLYLPSGHHWGWEPFWFQGYVPFLLYPHLTYVLLAIASLLPIEPHRLFNLYAVAIYLGLPLAAGWLVAHARGAVMGVLMAVWVAAASSMYGIGLRGVFHTGLLTQQAGLLVFLAFAYDILLSRRIDRAALWMGLAPLVHVHTAVLAGVAWLAEGVLRVLRRDASEPLRPWLVGSLVAALIATPTAVGLIVGWDQVGVSTLFGYPSRLFLLLMRGELLAPWPILAALLLGAFAAVPASKGAERRWALGALLVGVFFLVVALLNVGFPGILGRILVTMLRLRTLPFALLWLALLAAWGWPRLSRPVRAAMVVLTVAGLPTTWGHLATNVGRVANTRPLHVRAEAKTLRTLEEALAWVKQDAGERTATVLLNRSGKLRVALGLRRTLEVLGQPMIGGHGLELASVRNGRQFQQPESIDCPKLKATLRRYAVGYVIEADPERRAVYEKCLAIPAAFTTGEWGVVKLNGDWGSFAPAVRAFRRNDTWTELAWSLHPQPRPTRLVLPMANTAPWEATIDGRPLEFQATEDHMVAFDVPPQSSLLRMRYLGPPGEWSSVAVSGAGLVLGLVLVVRANRRRSAGRA